MMQSASYSGWATVETLKTLETVFVRIYRLLLRVKIRKKKASFASVHVGLTLNGILLNGTGYKACSFILRGYITPHIETEMWRYLPKSVFT
jgi:hypothetical protein